eukprot:TRINITY_DN270_c0_g1_i3.p1 TRINITY_DN270_c0_g1~~TRINITY_DN270_c0_g1_i3.p1  ORF type:complete len:209 (+),score=63.12 TRINITY_DN270_c0_g1_i3:131-757(+)
MKTALLLIALLGLTFAFHNNLLKADPPKPTWPKDFSASLDVQNWNTHERIRNRHGFYRWFYSSARNMDRIDGLVDFGGELVVSNQFFDHAAKKHYAVFYQADLATCFIVHLNRTLPHPNFDNVRYAGKAVFDYETVNHWFAENRERTHTINYYDTEAERLPARMDWHDAQRGETAIIKFREFDEGTQGEHIFTIPEEVLRSCNDETKA